MRMRNAEETTGTAGTVTSIHRRGPDGTLGYGCRPALPHHLDGKPILLHGGMLLFEMVRVFPHPGPEGHGGRKEAGLRDCGPIWSIPRAA